MSESRKIDDLVLTVDTGRVFQPPTIQFDGHRFYAPPPGQADLLYLAALARRGDSLARELCESLFLRVTDRAGRPYWPAPDQEQTPSPPTKVDP